MSTITYRLTSGQLPPGFRLIQDVEYAKLVGYPQLDAEYYKPPTFTVSSGQVLGAAPNTTVNLNLGLTAQDSKSIVGVSIVAGVLPDGLTLSPSGVLSGVLPALYDDSASYFSEEESPQVLESFAGTNIYNELNRIDDSLAFADRPCTYTIVNGNLPLGVVLNSNGSLSGTVDELLAPNLPDESFRLEALPPIWQTPRGLLGSFGELVPVNIPLSLTLSAAATSVTYTIIDGSMPDGLLLGPTTGVISGNTTELEELLPDDENYVEPPVFISGESLGNVRLGGSASISLQATLPNASSLESYEIIGGNLPIGLVMNTNGLINGSVDIREQKQTYTFTVRVTTNNGGYATKTFNLGVI